MKSFKKLPESPVHLSNTNLSFMSLLGGISQLLYLCEPSAYFQTELSHDLEMHQPPSSSSHIPKTQMSQLERSRDTLCLLF